MNLNHISQNQPNYNGRILQSTNHILTTEEHKDSVYILLKL